MGFLHIGQNVIDSGPPADNPWISVPLEKMPFCSNLGYEFVWRNFIRLVRDSSKLNSPKRCSVKETNYFIVSIVLYVGMTQRVT